MIKVVYIAVSRKHLEEEWFATLCDRFPPECLPDQHGVAYRWENGPDEHLVRVLQTLRETGMRPYSSHRGGGPGPGEYEIKFRRRYTHADLERAELLQPQERSGWFEEGRLADGRLVYTTQKPPPKSAYICLGVFAHGVLPKAKEGLEAAQLVGLAFRPTIRGRRLKGGAGYRLLDWPSPDRAYWEITSEIRMPPLWMGPGFKVYERDVEKPNKLYRGRVRPRRRWFKRSDLDRMPPFDLALTEDVMYPAPLWNDEAPFPREHQRLRVVSQRFYRVCRELKLPVDFEPYFIDEAN